MKTIPLIQPSSTSSSADKRPLQTEDIVNDPERSAALLPEIIAALSTVFDPELPVNIYDLGLVYNVVVDSSSRVGVRMTLTAPGCPAAQFLPGQVQRAVEAVPGVADATVDVIWDPPWTRERMSDTAKLQLNVF